jgi:membrane-bound lytic murein transglycosylase B
MVQFNRVTSICGMLFFGFAVLFSSAGSAQPLSERDTAFEPLQKQLVSDGFDKEKIGAIYADSQVSFNSKGISRFLTYREAKLNYDQFASSRSIGKAKKYMKAYDADLKRAEKVYGVDAEVITAIILVETRLGTGTGNSSVISTLSTMAALQDPEIRELFWKEVSQSHNVDRKRYDKWVNRKSKWAYKELKSLLEYTEREKIDPVKIRGSFAGAVGISQFMPSNILFYAEDGDGDGAVDLFCHADAIASVANYLKQNGWHPGIERKKAYKVVWSYNHSKYYVETILRISDKLKG